MTAPLPRYLQSQVLTATREQLVVLSYDGVLRFLARAVRGIEQGDYDEKHLGLTRAQALIVELRSTLDFSVSPALAFNLARLYDYFVQQLALADAEDDLSRVKQVMGLVEELREAWGQAARRTPAAEVVGE
jgi:flagellar protein FliS